MSMFDLTPSSGDALIVVDMQNDFITGSLAVDGANTEKFMANVNYYIHFFNSRNLPVIYTRDWHPADHISFEGHGDPNDPTTGLFKPHCVKNTWGAEFPEGLVVLEQPHVIHKGVSKDREEYSGFQALKEDGTSYLTELLLDRFDCSRVFVVGLATDFCVKATVMDAISETFWVIVVSEAIKAVNFFTPDDGAKALFEMIEEDVKVL